MRVELEFLDYTKCRVHEDTMVFCGSIPVPEVGERTNVAGHAYTVTKRDFIYLSGKDGFPDLKISIWVE
ncbi:hypothetical protein AB6D81_26110 [Vibrio splendidus]|uniref:hypothetical protein n=1 Tax=Vibrionaceae TaxID=641 RepID=UPI00354EC0D6